MKTTLTLLFFLCSLHLFAPTYNNEITHNRIYLYAWAEREMKVRKILQTIRIIESSDNYQAKGGSGEYGAYQYLLSTWKAESKRHFGFEANIESPEWQDMVSEMKVKRLIDQGYSIREIASIWNSGRPTYEGRKGINRHGVRYNVPKYVEKFNQIFYSL